MNLTDFYHQVSTNIGGEDFYREIYYKNTAAYESPIHNWQEFCLRYLELSKDSAVILPDEPPTRMNELLKEGVMFPDDNYREVEVIVNARYCPAFLHELEFIKLVYVFRGSCHFYLGGKRFPMSVGNVCIVAPGVEQALFSCHEDDVVINLLIRRSTFAESFGELLEINGGGIIADFFWKMLYHKPGGEVLLFDSVPHPLMVEGIMELYEETQLQAGKSNLLMKSLMISIFAYVLRENEQTVVCMEKKKMNKRYALAQYLQYMKQHIEEVTLSLLAEEFHKSEGYLSRYFRRETGNTFSHVLRDMKMKRASQLLVKTECSIGKIISLVGYEDESVFFRNFKAYFGMTPIIYRKKKRQGEYLYF